jgi:ADP-ribose pyrophosphatase YjhB (NUDIX family)
MCCGLTAIHPALGRMRLQRLRRVLEPTISRVLHFYWRFSRAATLGVRAMVIDGAGRIFLVKHSYVEGWHLPGGGVETGESLLKALTRELAEEGNIQLGSAPQLYAVYFNKRISRRDHVALFIVRDFQQDGHPQPNHEIIAHSFFAPDALPDDASRGTRARIAEVLGGAAISELW